MKASDTESDAGRVVLSRREFARELRRKAYRDAKERRAKDPRFLARQQELKEAAKLARKELYRQIKERKKASAAEVSQKLRAREVQAREARRAAADERAAGSKAALERLTTARAALAGRPLGSAAGESPAGENPAGEVESRSGRAGALRSKKKQLSDLVAQFELASEHEDVANDLE